MAKKPYQDYEENPWKIDSARYKFAPYLIVHCKRTDYWGSLTGTPIPTVTIAFTSGYSGEAFGSFSVTQQVVFDYTWTVLNGASTSGAMVVQNSASVYGRAATIGAFPNTGKFYMEASVNDTGALLQGFGIAVSSSTTTTLMLAAARSNAATGFIQSGASACSTQVTWTAGRLMLAVDIDNRKYWLGRAGTWFSSGDPGAGANPYIGNVPIGEWHVWWDADNDGNGVGRVRLKDSNSLSYSAPTGFSTL